MWVPRELSISGGPWKRITPWCTCQSEVSCCVMCVLAIDKRVCWCFCLRELVGNTRASRCREQQFGPQGHEASAAGLGREPQGTDWPGWTTCVASTYWISVSLAVLQAAEQFHACRRQWARVFLAASGCDAVPADIVEVNGEAALVNFFANFPGLKRWIGSICLLFYGEHAVGMTLVSFKCTRCGLFKGRDQYTKRQWKKRNSKRGAICKYCC